MGHLPTRTGARIVTTAALSLITLVTTAGAQTPTKTKLPANTPTLANKRLNPMKMQRFKQLPKKSTLAPLSTMQPQKLKISASGGTTLSRTKIPTKKTALPAKNEDTAGRYCTTRTVSEQNGEYSKIVLGNQSDKIYPGAIYGANAFTDGKYDAPPNLVRRPYQIATSLFSAASTGPSYVEVQPTLGQVNDGIVQLMRNNANVVNAANVAVEVSQIYSQEQLAFELQAGFQGYNVNLDAEFSYDKETEKRVIFAKLTQTYFSVMLNKPDGASLVENAAALGANTLYVNKVNYGRLGILKIETNFSQEEVQAALDFAYSQGNTAVSLAANANYKKLFSDIKIEGFFFGGDATNGMVTINCTRETCAQRLDEFNAYVRGGLRLNTMVAPTPISYELKYLSDNATAAVNSTTTYVERNCESAQGVTVTLNGISIDNVHEATWGNVCGEATCNSDCGYAWGSVKVEIEQRENGELVKTVPGFLGGKQADATVWKRSQSDPQRGVTNYKVIADKTVDSINNVERKLEYKLDPRVYAAGGYFLKITTDIKTNHKDNHLASLGFHGMKAAVVRDLPLKDALLNPSLARTDHKYGSYIAGPFSSESNRLHSFRAHFTVKPQ
jgi:thiol-activated cytolysin